jgi:hypothetical protein
MNNQQTLVFERPPIPRLISCASVFGTAGIFFMYLADHPTDYEILPMAVIVLLFLGTVVAMTLQYGDHIYLGAEGVKYENRLLRLFGRIGRWMQWDDIVEIREVRDKMLILMARDGRRVLVDAIVLMRTGQQAAVGYAIARAEILRRAPQAILTGTLAPDE